jgi:hypothetical protein
MRALVCLLACLSRALEPDAPQSPIGESRRRRLKLWGAQDPKKNRRLWSLGLFINRRGDVSGIFGASL